MEAIEECRALLMRGGGAETQEAEIKRKALARLSLLSAATVRLCDLASTAPDAIPAKTLELVWGIEGLLRGLESVHRLLRQILPESDGVVKPAFALRKGPLRELTGEVFDAVVVSEPSAWIVVPALRTVLDTFEALVELAEA